MKGPRYMVQSDHVRGERRAYWVVDMHKQTYRSNFAGEIVDGKVTNDRRTAERWCEKLNKDEGT